jgi:parvulin-like peptidyl-prolyl isomerase
VFELKPARWHGPVLSGYGVHLVYVHRRQEAPTPNLTQVEERVRQDWEDARREDLNARFIAGVLARYKVTIEDGAPGEQAQVVKDQAR